MPSDKLDIVFGANHIRIVGRTAFIATAVICAAIAIAFTAVLIFALKHGFL